MLLYLVNDNLLEFSAVEVTRFTGTGTFFEEGAAYIVAKLPSFSFLTDQSFATIASILAAAPAIGSLRPHVGTRRAGITILESKRQTDEFTWASFYPR